MRRVPALAVTSPAMAADVPSAPEPCAIIALHDYGTCLAKKRPRVVRELLAMDYRNDDYQKAIRSIAGPDNGCAPNGRLAFAALLALAVYRPARFYGPPVMATGK